MQFSFFQKFTSFFLLFFLLFSFTVRIPFVAFVGIQTYADEEKFYNLVSVIVDEDIYSQIRSKLVRYTQDIQGVLENTRVVILPTPSTATALDIASLNEKLYFEGYKGVKDVNFESKLVGTVLVGDIPVPVLFDGDTSSRSLTPYIDFEEKTYIYNHEVEKYQYDTDAPGTIEPEIWHGVISPNSGDRQTDIDLIQGYFDKNHDFYEGEGNFQTTAGIVNGKVDQNIPDSYEPYVFYYDQFRETQALNYEKYEGYRAYLQNQEDIVYNRYTAELAEKIKNQVLGTQNDSLKDLIEKAIPGFSTDELSTGPDTEFTPDVQTRFITDNATNKFLEIFNEGTLADIRKYVHNAGRYNGQGSEVNVDMAPFLISILDEVSIQVVKNINTNLEGQIDDIVKNGLARDIAIPTGSNFSASASGTSGGEGSGGSCGSSYNNFYYGLVAENVESARDCSIYRGSVSGGGKLVEANRGMNISLIQSDLNRCGPETRTDSDGKVTAGIQGYWGGNTPFNLQKESLGSNLFELDTHDLQGGIVPVFDIVGSVEESDTSKVPSPLDCYNANFIQTQSRVWERRGSSEDGDDVCVLAFQAPVLGASRGGSWNCSTINRKIEFPETFDSQYPLFRDRQTTGNCTTLNLTLEEQTWTRPLFETCGGGGGPDGSEGECSCDGQKTTQNYVYKKIPSYIEHKSPTNEEFGAQISALTSPDLPVDRDRYIDFISADGQYAKINYPYLFRVSPEPGQELTLENIDTALENHLDEVSQNINNVVISGNPNSLTPIEREIYELLKRGDYPSANIDLHQDLKNRPLQTFTIDGDAKQVSYYDTLVFAIYWNNLKTVSGKYKFIFENYLSDQFGGNDFLFNLPKNKKSYEVAYLGAPGDTQNMYIKMDPEEKGVNPYASIIAKNIALNTSLLSSNVISPSGEDGTFACAPPDGVPIWEWIPAVICWLQDMLPPTIGVSEGACGPSLLSQEEQEEILECQGDVNKNGISDCIEGKLTDGTLDLLSDAEKYYYNSVGNLGAIIRDKNGAVVTLDSISYVDFELTKLEIPDESTLEFTQGNTRTIYDKNDENFNSQQDYENVQEYLNFRDTRVRVGQGKALTYFSAKRSDVNVEFVASVTARDNNNDTQIYLESDVLEVQVRGDRLFLNSYLIEGTNPQDVTPAVNTLKVSDLENVFLIDTNQQYVEDVAENIFAINTNPQKALLALTNYSKNGNVLSLDYPLTFQIQKDGEIIYEETDITQSDLATFKPLSAVQTSGRLDFIIKDASGYKANKTIDVIPEVASNIDVELGTTISQTGGNLTTHIATIKDRFGNIASGEIYEIAMDISGGGLNFYDTKDDTFTSRTVEGYKIFRVESTQTAANNTLNFEVKNIAGDTLTNSSANLRTIEGIDIDIQSTSGDILVGGGLYNFDIELTDTDGNLLSDFNSRAYMVLNPLYGTTPEAYVEIAGGKATLQLQTTTIAAREVKLEFQVEGMSSIVQEYIDILPDDPIQLNLSLSRDKIEASSSDFTYLYAVLKDRYGNEVFTDNTTQLNLEILPEYANIITSDTATQTVSQGKGQFQISGTQIPGVGYFKVSTSPNLDENSFSLEGQAPFEKDRLTIPTMKNSDGLTDTGKLFFKEYNSETYISQFTTQYRLESSEPYQDLPNILQNQVVDFWNETNSLVINGVGENAGKVETFYFWNEENISGNKYNGIYSVLLGAPYGDITQPGYLGGSLLFDPDNRSLAVTSLINNPYKYSDVLLLSQAGNLKNISGGGDITQDIRLRADFDPDNRMYIDIFNDALGTYIGKAYYNLGETELISCQETSLSSCISQDQTSTSIHITDTDFTLVERGDDLVLKNNFGSDAIVFFQDGTIQRKSSVYVEVDDSNDTQYVRLNILSGDTIIGHVAVNLVNGNINITRDETLLENKLQTLENTLIVYLKTNQYGTRDIFQKNGNSLKVIFYNDPFGSNYVLDSFHESQAEGFENFHQTKGLGWESGNKSLLAFSSGESVGESTQKYYSFSLINLGDPVVNLPKIQRTFINAPSLEKSFDPTIGKRISGDDSIIGYQVFDYNNDAKDDIVLIKTDGYIELLENKDIASDYLPKGNLVYAVDGGPVRLVKTGNFTGDNYDDIFFVSNDGEPVIFNNQVKDFVRISLEEQFSLSGSIIQAEVFDMDNDTRDDIVTLDDAGQIHIFYGGGDAQNPQFTKLKVGDGYGIKLSETLFSRGGAVYFDELPDIDDELRVDELITSNEEFQAELQSAIDSGTDEPEGEFFNELLADRLLFVKLPYSPYIYDPSVSQSQNLVDSIDSSIDTTNYPDLDEYLEESETALENFINENGSYIDFNNSYGQSRMSHFLRSEYADTQGLTIEKRFVDTSPEFLQTGDLVQVELRLENTGTQRLNNVAFVDTIARNFVLESQEITVVSEDGKTITAKPGLGMFDMLIDGFFLDPGEEVVLQYTLKTLPLKYGYLQAGLFEEGELGDDEWGDIILKPNNLNCGDEADIYTSIAQRSYIKGKTIPTCDEDKLELPEDIGKNALDNDGNGVPDYIDALVGGPEQDVLDYAQDVLDYAQDVLDEMHEDTDGDGVPNSEDELPNTDENSLDIMSAIAEINGVVDEVSDQLDTVIEGFSCGFGGGSCIATPLNWAPLAPGGDPTLFGYPIGDGLKVNEGIPIFSALTGIQTVCGTSPCCIPATYPASPLGFVPGPACGAPSAGGYLGTWAPTNYVRLFATPTLTGGAGIAACFGGPAIVKGNIPPPGVHPIAPGGNCVVAAVPLLGCQGEEGDPTVTGNPWTYPQYGVINANCPAGAKEETTLPEEIDNSFVQDYLQYKETGVKTPGLVEKFKDAFSQVAEGGGNWNIPSGPLVNIGGGGDTDMSLSVDFDASALSSGNFEDVIQIQNTRISPFPDFLMDWVTRQLEEVVNKLTNLPKIFVILPDFSGIFDYGWENFGDNIQDSFESGTQVGQNQKAQYQAQIESLQQRKAALGGCEGDNASICSTIDSQIRQLNQKKNFSSPETLSGIKAAYEFLGNVPLVALESETINVNIPWIDAAALERASLDWKFSLDQWKAELQRAAGQWSLGTVCNFSDPAEQSACQERNNIAEKLNLDAQKLIGSLEKNIEIIEEYKRLPEKLNKLISIKEVRLEQILCNIEAISSLLGGWIDENGERFKAWVELFVLIKSILKSWQLLIDVFKGYDEECHQCKNERQDLQTFIWKLISSVIPKLPIIQFPKWPDIILDLHNVRAGITIYLPDFEINLRPIVLPTLPELKLPDVPSVNLQLPELPILPEFTIPELPELPSLPTVELPDLPPPPKIPKLFGAVEGILNIMKLVTKVMCIIKQSPFVPEWRAGDQIAYITERSGYLSFDFIDISLPQFSYPFVDAIKVTTYVNFEFETEFILEAVRQITAPLDTFTNDISNMFQIQVPDIDFSGNIPDSINVDINLEGDVEVDGLGDISEYKGTQRGFELLAVLFASKIQDLLVHVQAEKDVVLTNSEFIAFVNENLAAKAVVENPRMDEIRRLWEDVGNMTYSKENTLIEELQENRKSKFEELSNILTTEIQKTQNLKDEIYNIGDESYITKVAFEQGASDVDAYNTRLESYNQKLIDSAKNLISGGEENKRYQQEISTAGTAIKDEVRAGLTAYQDSLENPRLLSADVDGGPAEGAASSCSYSGDSYKYVYEGLYMLEFDRHYRLFEYLDELRGDEYVTPTDVDGDGDDDLLYMMNNQLFLKENLKNTDTKEYVSLPPLILNSGDNEFYNGDIYFEAVNGFAESNISDSFINVRFKAPTNNTLDNFRMEFYTIVDKFRNLGDESYIPTGVKKFVVDAVADIEENTLIEENENYTLGKHVAYISSASVIPGVTLTNTKLINIREDLTQNTIVTLTSGSKLSAGNTNFTIEYYTDNPEETTSLSVQKHSYVSFPSLTYIVGLSGDAYAEGSILEDISGAGLVGHIGKPLFPGAKITYSGNDATLTEASYIGITHADGSQIDLHMRDVDNYRLYDLGSDQDEHLIRLKVENDFYYAKIYAFQQGIDSTYSQQILLSPQTQADTQPPQIGLNQKIRIPVYQKQTFDFTPYIYEDSGIDNIVDVKIDFDFAVDTDQDGDARNDRDTENINILQTPTTIKVEFGAYEELFERKIRLSLTDGNGNMGYKDIDFEVYPPAPQIQDFQDDTILGVIDETLLDEPVRIYRLRGGAIKKLENTQGTDLVQTDEDGSYGFGVPETSSGLKLQKDGVDVATINEYTGRITVTNPLTNVSVLASNDPRNTGGFPRVAINYVDEEISYQYIQPKYDPEIQIITSVEEIETEGIYVRILDQELYNSFTVPAGVSFNPGAVIIHLAIDEDKQSVFSVFRDGRVYSADVDRYILKYQSVGERSSYVLHDTLSQTDIAQVILDIEASYILR